MASPRGSDGHPQQVFPLKLKAGKHYIIEMRSDPKGSWTRGLLVLDATGKMLIEDDGSGGLFDAILAFSPPKDGDYQIVATTTRGRGRSRCWYGRIAPGSWATWAPRP